MIKKLLIVIIYGLSLCSIANSAPLPSCAVNQSISDYMSVNKTLRPQVLNLALKAYSCAIKKGIAVKKPILTIIDYSLPSNVKRFWTIDLASQQVIYNTLVAHGKYSGTSVPSHFSDEPGTLESSIGLYITGKTYLGHDGYSLVLQGLDKGFNDKAEARHIIMHGAWYVSENYAKRFGRIGRSWGCPVLDKKVIRPVINEIKNGTLFFAYYPNKAWLRTSIYLHC